METDKYEKNSFIKIFLVFFKMGAVTFGGGYAMLPIIESELVAKAELITKEEYMDFISVAQSFPGPIAVNMALLIGNNLKGKIGSLLALLGVVLPSFITILIVGVFYSYFRDSKIVEGFFRGVNGVVPALLLVSFLSVFKSMKKDWIVLTLALVTVVGVSIFNLNPLWMILLGGVVGICIHYSKFFSSLQK